MRADPAIVAVFDSLFDESLEEGFLRVLDSSNLDFKNTATVHVSDPKALEGAPLFPQQLTRGFSFKDVLAQLNEQEDSVREYSSSIPHASAPNKLSGRKFLVKAESENLKSESRLENPLVCGSSGSETEEEEEEAISKQEKTTLRKRKSEDWDSKPRPQQKRRIKWEKEELTLLWKGIAQHGNNWTAIKNTVGSRSYCQIKDKGRRALFLLGWQTGRSKTETDSSGEIAKKIAEKVIAGL